MKKVPVVDKKNKPLMPTSCSRARRWIKSRKATPFWKRGIFCIRLNFEPSDRQTQPIVVGIDPGSKKEGYTVKSKACTFLNIQADAVTWVKKAMKTRRDMRKHRRYRKTPCRKPRFYRNRGKSFLPPSTKARWQWKLRVINWLNKIFPISDIIVEDISTKTKKGCKKWNKSFGSLQVGKNWFYGQLPNYQTKKGFETKALRDKLSLHKLDNKMSNNFYVHCVDSWVLANSVVGGHIKPDNTNMYYLTPIRFHRRQLHYLRPNKKGKRPRYGGTRSLGLKKGSIVKHKKLGVFYVGGHDGKGEISLCDLKTGNRIGNYYNPADCKFSCFNSWRFTDNPKPKTKKNKLKLPKKDNKYAKL